MFLGTSMRYEYSIRTNSSRKHLVILGSLLYLLTSVISSAQSTDETEIKHQRTLKDFSPIEILPKLGDGQWCGWIADEPGTLFDKPTNPAVQSVVIFGNPQWQYSHVSGTDSEGNDFSGDEFLLRRFKLGVRIHFLNYFTSSFASDVEDDGEPKENSDYNSFDYALQSSDVIFDAKDAFNWDRYDQFQLRLGYFKVPSNAGWARSSNSMQSIERDSLTNYSSPSDSMGAMLSGRLDRWDFDLGLFSGNDINNGLDNNSGSFWFARLGYMFGERQRLDSLRTDLRLLINNETKTNETFQQNWVVSWSTLMRQKHWRLMGDLIIGENGNYGDPTQQGSYWGLSLMPSIWLIEDRLEVVFRYQYAEAKESNGFRISSHSARRIADQEEANINDGYGDKHQSAYAGINYYICGDNTKIMAGLQWDDLQSSNEKIYEGLTTWVALRLYF